MTGVRRPATGVRGAVRLLAAALVPAAIAFPGLGGCDFEPPRETSVEEIAAGGRSRLLARLESGSIRVTSHQLPGFHITVERVATAGSAEAARAALASLVVEVSEDEAGDAVIVRGRAPSGGTWRLGERRSLSLRIAVPESTAVDLWTADGRIHLEDLAGPVNAVSFGGRITATGLRSPMNGNGDPVFLRTADGRIEGTDLQGRVDAESGDGRISLDGRLTEVRAVTGDGSVSARVRGDGNPLVGNWLLSTADDDRVQLVLPEGVGANLSVVARDGIDAASDEVRLERIGPFAEGPVSGGGAARIRLRGGRARIRIVP